MPTRQLLGRLRRHEHSLEALHKSKQCGRTRNASKLDLRKQRSQMRSPTGATRGAYFRRLCARMDKRSANTATVHRLARGVVDAVPLTSVVLVHEALAGDAMSTACSIALAAATALSRVQLRQSGDRSRCGNLRARRAVGVVAVEGRPRRGGEVAAIVPTNPTCAEDAVPRTGRSRRGPPQ